MSSALVVSARSPHSRSRLVVCSGAEVQDACQTSLDAVTVPQQSVLGPLHWCTYLAHGGEHDAGQVLRERADDVGHLAHALGVAHRAAPELVDHVDLLAEAAESDA